VTSVEQAGRSRRCAVIYNPTKVSEKFRALMEDNLHRGGWGDTLWLETSVEDPGRAMTRQAVAEQGKSNAEVAALTYLSPNTVKSYIRTIYRKIEVSSRTQAVLWGVRHGFTPDHHRIEHWRGGP
jgi:hypothetical protein